MSLVKTLQHISQTQPWNDPSKRHCNTLAKDTGTDAVNIIAGDPNKDTVT